MTDLAEKVDLETAAEGVKSLYKAPQPKVLDPDSMDKSLLSRMPQPTGWRMLILPYSGPKKTKGGLYLSEQTQETMDRVIHLANLRIAGRCPGQC